jgi:hypothetical protein
MYATPSFYEHVLNVILGGASIGTWNMMMPSSSRFTVPVFTLVAAFPSFYRIVHPLPSPVDIKTVM